MAYVGLVPQQSLLSTFSETFSGDGSTLQFNLSRAVSKATDLEVFIANTQQLPTVAYTASGTQLLFVSAPTAGSNNITVIYRAGALQTINVTNQSFNQGTVVAPSVNSTIAPTTGIYWPSTTDLGISANGALKVQINDSSDSTSTSTGAMVVVGGVGISGNVYTGGDARITSTTAASSSSTGALVVSGGAGVGGKLYVADDLTVAGDFTVNGTFTTTASDSLAITDPFVFLAANNAGDALDQGFVGKYVDGGSVTRYTGFFRDVTDGSYKLFDNLTNQPTTVVDTGNASFAFGNLTLGILSSSNITAGNIRITSNTISSLDLNGDINISPNGSGNVNINDAVYVTSSVQATQFISNISTGTAPFTVTSTTQVANLNVATAGTAGTAGTVTTAAQPNITSVGNLTIANIDNIQIDGNTISSTNTNGNIDISPNGTGNINLNDPVQVTSTVQATQFISNIATGTAPFVVTSTTQVANLNVAAAGTAVTAGSASTAVNLSTNGSNWSTNGTITAVVGQLAWKNYGNNHTIFDASNSTAPNGTAKNNTNPDVAWSGTYPTLMGWNGSSTYGVRVDSARYSDQSKYADLAEKYLADQQYPVGTVLMIGGTAEVTLAEKDSRAIVGVVSENGFIMNADLQGENVTAIGYIGRVPCRVIGKIKKGDFLIVGDTPGIAIATPYSNDLTGKLIGKSLADYDSDDEGIIEILVGRL